ncbi:MAG: hypothetical protein ACLP7J_29910 [Streptosporangiaceae bacterium]
MQERVLAVRKVTHDLTRQLGHTPRMPRSPSGAGSPTPMSARSAGLA